MPSTLRYAPQSDEYRIIMGNLCEVLIKLPKESVDGVVTSPPYFGLRDYSTVCSKLFPLSDRESAKEWCLERLQYYSKNYPHVGYGVSVKEVKVNQNEKHVEVLQAEITMRGVIWGGSKDCEHEWKYHYSKLHSGRGDAQKSGKYSEQPSIPDIPISDAFCRRCGAWYGQFGLEPTMFEYVKHTGIVASLLYSVVKNTGSVFWVIGDTFMKKSLMRIPERVSKEFERCGWQTKQMHVWHKPNHIPSSVKDRLASSYEFIIHFVKNSKHYCNHKAVLNEEVLKQFGYKITRDFVKKNNLPKETKNKFLVDLDPYTTNLDEECHHTLPPRLSLPTRAYRKFHYAVYPLSICVNPIILACPPDGVVLDPFVGSGTTMQVAKLLKRRSIGIEINARYEPYIVDRLEDAQNTLKLWKQVCGT